MRLLTKNEISELYEFIDRSSLPQDMGGTGSPTLLEDIDEPLLLQQNP